MVISILFPFRGDAGPRSRIFDWVISYWANLLPNAEIIVSDCETDSFNRSAARNDALSLSTGDLVIFVDADTVIPISQLRTAIEMVRRGSPWVLPYTVYYNMTENDTERLLGTSPEFSAAEPVEFEHRLTESVAGVLVVPREAVEMVQGYDERFSGWGGEDRAFALALDTLYGRHDILDGYISHLWHPRGEADFSQPNWPFNANLLRLYQSAAGNPERMRQVLP